MALDRAKSAQLRSLLQSASQRSNGYVTTDDELEDDSDEDSPQECDCDCDCEAAEWGSGERHTAACPRAQAASKDVSPGAAINSTASTNGQSSGNTLCLPQPRFARAETATSIDSVSVDTADSPSEQHNDAFK